MRARGNTRWREQRGSSHTVGLVLMFGVVIIAATSVFVIGVPALDAVSSQADRERVQLCMGEADHQIETAASLRTDRSLGDGNTDCQPGVSGDGELSVTWFNSSTESPDWNDGVSQELGTFEFGLEDHTIVHQGGGIWASTGNDVRIERSPGVGFAEDGSLEMDLLHIDRTDDPSFSSVRHDYASAQEATEDLLNVTQRPTDDDLALRVESEYADGWERHFERETESVDRWNVTVEGPDDLDQDAVEVTVESIGHPSETQPGGPQFLIEADHGLIDNSGDPIDDNFVEPGETTEFFLDATIENHGTEAGSVSADLVLYNESTGDRIADRTIESKSPKEEPEPDDTIRIGDQNTWDWNWGQDRFDITDIDEIEPGNEYEYDIETTPGGDSLTERGTFVVDNEPPEFEVTEIDLSGEPVIPEVDSLDVSATIENTGGEAEQFVFLEGFDGSTVDVADLDLSNGDSETVDLEWDVVGVPDPDDEITVRTGTENEQSEPVDIEPRLEVTEIDVVGGEPLDKSETDEIDIDVGVESIGGEAEPDVDLEYDGETYGPEETTDVDGTETLTFEDVAVAERTDRVTATTDDDELEEVVVVERDGPECGEYEDASDYNGSGTAADPFQIETVDQLQCMDGETDLHTEGYHWELVDDIDAQGTEYWNDGDGFNPIGNDAGDREWVWNGEWERVYDPDDDFVGQFDGNGHTIEGLYIDRSDDTYVGLFGVTDGEGPGQGESRIENLRLEDVDVHGKDRVGGIAGVMGGTMEQSSVTGDVEADGQRVGLVVGRGAGADLTGQLSARGDVVAGAASGQFDRGVGSIVGRTSWDTDLDTGYAVADLAAPEYVGGLMGSSSTNPSSFSNMYAANDVTGEPSGAITGLVEDSDDEFTDSVYWDQEVEPEAFGDTEGGSGFTDDWQPRDTDQMKGPSVLPTEGQLEADGIDPDEFYDQYPGVTADDAEGTMANLNWDIWEPVYEVDPETGEVVNEDYPQFTWELEADGQFTVAIDDVENVTAGDTAAVNVTVTSLFQDPDEENRTQLITLEDPGGNVVAAEEVELESSFGDRDTTEITLEWQTRASDAGIGEVSVQSEDTVDFAPIEVRDPPEPFEPTDRTGKADGELPIDPDIEIDIDAVDID